MEFILTDEKGIEIGPLTERDYIDIDCGKDNTFEIQVTNEYYKKLGISDGWRLGVPGKEYGGIIDKIKNNSSTNEVILSGPTWRGLLTKKIIEPDPGEDYKVVSGEANTIINNLSCVEFDGIFSCTSASGIMINNYHFERYVDHLAGLEKMLLTKNARLNIAYDSGEPNKASYVKLSAVPIEDYSDEIEYSRDGTLSFLTFEFERYTGGINHLICLGKGDLKDRLVIHLYVQNDGSIGSEKYYTGKDERVDVYDYPNAESAAELQEKGIERLKKLMSYTNMDMDLVNQSLSGIRGVTDSIDIGDIVGGRDFDTGIYLSKQITRKIIRVKNGKESIEYSVGKNTLNRSTATAPVEPEDTYQKQIDALKKFTEDFTTNLLSKIYPVGSIYMSVKNVSPQSFLGGTWVAWGSGRVPVSVNSSDSSFNTVEKTGGAKTVTLTVDQLPSHSHDEKIAYYNSDSFLIRPMASDFSEQNSGNYKILKGDAIVRSSGTGPLKTGEIGSGKSHNNLQPYITCYMWKRTA